MVRITGVEVSPKLGFGVLVCVWGQCLVIEDSMVLFVSV